MSYLLGIDQGTSGTTVVAVDLDLRVGATSTEAVHTEHSQDNVAEQDPWHVLDTVVSATGRVVSELRGSEVIAVGFDHQGETVIAWDRRTLEPLTPAIVWSDRRASTVADRIRAEGRGERVREISGSPIDPYFCAAKYRWILESNPQLGELGDDLAIGTLQTWLLAQLGLVESTDIGTASRTQLTALGANTWNHELLEIFGVDESYLVEITPSLESFGDLRHDSWNVPLSLSAVVVDQPGALAGNGCLDPGTLKVTYGTGAFLLANVGREKPDARTRLIPSVGWGDHDGPVFTLDGGVFAAGSGLRWLGDLGIDVDRAAHSRLLDRGPTAVRVIPALSGLGAPHWQRGAQAVIEGLSASSTGEDLLQAYLDSIAFRIKEIFDELSRTWSSEPEMIRVDGGLTTSDYLMQRQADVLNIPIALGKNPEATAIGAASLAGLAVGALDKASVIEGTRPSRTIQPKSPESAAEEFSQWSDILEITLGRADS